MKLKHVAMAAALTLMMGCIFAYAQQPPEEKAEQTEQTTCCPDEAVPEKDVQSDEENPSRDNEEVFPLNWPYVITKIYTYCIRKLNKLLYPNVLVYLCCQS